MATKGLVHAFQVSRTSAGTVLLCPLFRCTNMGRLLQPHSQTLTQMLLVASVSSYLTLIASCCDLACAGAVVGLSSVCECLCILFHAQQQGCS
jgi:hypothetical protein